MDGVLEDRLYSMKELSAALSVTAAGIYRWIKQGTFPAGMQLGTLRRFPGQEINAWLEARRVASK